jgi:hypothetical protein
LQGENSRHKFYPNGFNPLSASGFTCYIKSRSEGTRQLNHEDSIRDELFTDPEEVVTFAQAYYATEFPNGERRACPTAGSLRAAAHSGNLPDEQLRAHLFECSECFRIYRGARMSHRSQAAAGRSPWRRWGAALAALARRPVPLAVAASCLVFLGAGAAALLWQARKDRPSVAVNYSRQETLPHIISPPPPQASNPGAVDALKPPASQPQRTPVTRNAQARRRKAESRNTRFTAALPVVEINLKEEDLLRGDGGDTQRVIRLSPARQRLRLRMPRGSVSGRYTVKIVDAFGKPLVTTVVNSDGKTLTAELDLRTLTANKYRLCLAREGEAPDCYLVSVNE